jgi:pimeloyl-ACP methyl ester carboxylesterase
MKLRLLFCAFVALIKTFFVLPLFPLTLLWNVRKAERELLEKHGPEPVLFLHGFLSREEFWFYPFSFLKKRGAKNLFTLQLGGPNTPIEKGAERIKKRVEEILEKTGNTSLRLVCHSMGGVAALYYLKQLQGEKNVSVCVAIASPFRGSKLASLLGMFFLPARQIDYRSPFLLSLLEKPWLKHTAVIHLHSRVDELVWPHASCYHVVSEKRTLIALDDVGHAQALFSKKVCRILALFLHP